ncbi:MAG: GIY-YIG nuclease family protein [Selenomonadaceae bacterium]
MIGIYRLTCDQTGKSYIGQSKDIRRRMWEHKRPNSMKNSELKKDILRYGFDSFKQEVLEECPIDRLDEREKFYIAKYKPEYNVSIGGKGPKGYHVSAANKALLREYGKRQWASKSDEEKQQIIQNNLRGPAIGHQVSQETRAKLRAANLGKKQSAETIAKRAPKISKAMKGNRNGNKPVRAVELNKEFSSVKEAASFVGVNPGQVTAALKGRNKTCRGYHWKYLQ